MLKSYDNKSSNLTKINFQQIKQTQLSSNNTAESHTNNALQSQRSQRSINQRITPSLSQKQYKQKATLFFRNSIRCILRKHFKQMLSRLMMRRMCFKLLKTKGKRDLQRGFLTIRNYTQQNAHNIINQFYHRQPQVRIFASIFNKILAKPQKEVMSRIRTFTLRKRRVEHFVICLLQRIEYKTQKEGLAAFWSIVHLQAGKSKQKQFAAQLFSKWGHYHIKEQLQQSFHRLNDLRLCHQSWQKIKQQKQKQQKMLNNINNRKQAIMKLRQQLKATKIAIDQQKLAKNKVYQQHKKYTHTNKIEMTQNVRKYEKELKIEQASYKQVQCEFNEWQRLLKIRKEIADKGVGSETRCIQIYCKLHREPDSIVKQLQTYVPSLRTDVNEFKQNQVYLFMMNARMGKLVELYEKRQPYNYQAEYYELQYENNVLRQTIRCFLRQKYEAYMAMKRAEKSRSKAQLQQT